MLNRTSFLKFQLDQITHIHKKMTTLPNFPPPKHSQRNDQDQSYYSLFENILKFCSLHFFFHF